MLLIFALAFTAARALTACLAIAIICASHQLFAQMVAPTLLFKSVTMLACVETQSSCRPTRGRVTDHLLQAAIVFRSALASLSRLARLNVASTSPVSRSNLRSITLVATGRPFGVTMCCACVGHALDQRTSAWSSVHKLPT